MKTKVLFETRNDLRESARAEVVELLNRQLADGLDLQLQLKHAHWNVKGPGFFPLHELFDKLTGEIGDLMDTVAERATALGGLAEGTVRQVAAASRLPEFPAEIVDGTDHLRALAERYAAYARTTRAAIDAATEAADMDTADLFTEVSRALDKHLWFLEAHLQGSAGQG